MTLIRKSVLKRSPLRKKSKSERSKLITQCDDIFRDIIRERDKVCQRTGKTMNLQVAHYITRKNLHLRWNKDNVVLLNKGSHYFWAHMRKEQFREFMIKRIGEKQVKHFEMLDRMSCKPLYTCEIRIIRQELLKERDLPAR